jgi:hypothetical protein
MGALPQALEIIFEVQRKNIDEKVTRKNKNFPTYYKLLFFLLFGSLLLSNLKTFYFLFILNNLKCYKGTT